MEELRGIRANLDSQDPVVEYRVHWKDGSPDTWCVIRRLPPDPPCALRALPCACVPTVCLLFLMLQGACQQSVS